MFLPGDCYLLIFHVMECSTVDQVHLLNPPLFDI